MKWIKANSGVLLSILLVTFTIAIFGPLEMYCTNSGEFWFSFSVVLRIVCILVLICMICFVGILLILRGKDRKVYGALLFALGVALYIQGNYANINYGILDGTEVDWGAYPVYATLDTVGWIILVAVLLFLFNKKEKWFNVIQRYVSLYIVGIQVLTLVVLLLTGESTKEKSEYFLSTEGMFEVSSDENIIVFVLDSFDDRYFQELYQKEPEKYDDVFSDFTYFNNASTVASRTRAALPLIITGEVYPGEMSYVEYIEKSFDHDGMYSKLKKKNYDIRMYTDSIYVPDNSNDKVDNQESSGYGVNSYAGLTKKYFDLTLYKYMPHVLKRFFWLYTGDFGQYKKGISAESYNTDDGKFMKDLSLKTIEGSNAFRLYHLTGAHGPYFLDENAVEHTEPTDVMRQAEGVLKIVDEYISQLKELGVYDDSTIIIMADHGDINEKYGIQNDAHGILFVKMRDSKSPFSMSSAPVSYSELHGTVFAELGENSGETFFDIPEGEERRRFFYKYTTKAGAFVVEEFSIDGRLTSQQVLKSTGRVIAPTIAKEDYVYGTLLTFGVDSTALPYISSGISGTDEGDYTWTSGKECIFRFPLERLPQNNVLISIDTISVYTENGPQEVKACINGILCYQDVVDKAGKISFVVPKDVVCKNDVMELRLYLPNAISPLELFGNAGDARELSLAISGLCIEETEQELEQKISVPFDSALIVFNKTNEALNSCLRKGFSSPEESFTWTDGENALLALEIENMPLDDVECVINIVGVYDGAQQVKISSMGVELYYRKIESSDTQISFVIPKECQLGGGLTLLFEFPNATSPKEQGKGNDERKLALAIKSIELKEQANVSE